jgi:hypothetical protein
MTAEAKMADPASFDDLQLQKDVSLEVGTGGMEGATEENLPGVIES